MELLLQIPKGKVTTYRALAVALGDPIASRAVGRIMAANEQPDYYPCYKVVHSDGRVGKYSSLEGPAEKIRRLRADGVPITGDRISGFAQYLFNDFDSDKPLKRLSEVQKEIVSRVSLEPDRTYRTVGGVDVSYGGTLYGETPVAAYTGFEIETKRPFAVETLEQQINFPYIPSYLAFRELPILVALLGKVREKDRLADVVMVDGNGLLHQRSAGIATHLGVLLDIPTIGIAKSLLVGEMERDILETGEWSYIRVDGERRGAVVQTKARTKPIYVSPGHRIDLATAVELTLRLSSHKVPEPIRAAHRASQEAVAAQRPASGQQSLF